MSIRVKAAAAALAAALSITPAFAEILNFSWEYAPGEVATWSQPSDPTPIVFDGISTLVEVSGGTNNLGQKFQSVWYDNADVGDGGLQIGSAEAIGYAIFTGPQSAPIFSPGRYLVETYSPTSNFSYVVVTVAPPAVPEPSTWAMMLIGFVGLGYAAVRRKGARRGPGVKSESAPLLLL